MASTLPNITLDAPKLIATADTMAIRIRERFAGSGLSGVAEDVAQAARRAQAIARGLERPYLGVRLLGVTATAAVLALALFAGYTLRVPMRFDSAAELVQGFEALLNIIVFGGLGIFFVFSLESRIKRSKALKLIAGLRSLAHVIDMHQLAKDPDRLTTALPQTEHSPPKLQLTPDLLTRYLDYCSELLAILSKLAALQVQKFDDPVTLDAVTDLEDLASGLSRKIWQKIMIIDRVHGS